MLAANFPLHKGWRTFDYGRARLYSLLTVLLLVKLKEKQNYRIMKYRFCVLFPSCTCENDGTEIIKQKSQFPMLLTWSVYASTKQSTGTRFDLHEAFMQNGCFLQCCCCKSRPISKIIVVEPCILRQGDLPTHLGPRCQHCTGNQDVFFSDIQFIWIIIHPVQPAKKKKKKML